ncbi:hypothetical protein [Idiomarina zobellii]|uniref:Uncharacterized protein n=1 Tax=Idiomarina zobellii TaxID=86103 RepID=A0A837NH01_9GAMM|nr:hypothetical protein [Idiomarina zobellii]KPD24438.1 hypothetical protein AFK76_02150 [Idiomarina zobellii]
MLEFYLLKWPQQPLSGSPCGYNWWWQEEACKLFSKPLVIGNILTLLPLESLPDSDVQIKSWVWIWWFRLPPEQQAQLRRQLSQVS